jgi:hypothetical protein
LGGSNNYIKEDNMAVSVKFQQRIRAAKREIDFDSESSIDQDSDNEIESSNDTLLDSGSSLKTKSYKSSFKEPAQISGNELGVKNYNNYANEDTERTDSDEDSYKNRVYAPEHDDDSEDDDEEEVCLMNCTLY